MFLIEILLPLYDNDGQPIAQAAFAGVRRDMVDRFGGVTAHVQAPARGIWEAPSGHVQRDDVVIFEVMVETLDRDWWRAWRLRVEGVFRQQEIVVRSTAIERL